MPYFSERSKLILETCHPKLIQVVTVAIEDFDFSVISGHRGEEEQNLLRDSGASHLGWPDSKHNREPGEAVDVAPYPIDWSNTKRFILLGGYLLAIGKMLNIKLRWGGDWDGDFIMTDQNFHDLPHFELMED